MITNDSSLTSDLETAGQWVEETAKDAGQAVGLVEADVIPGDPSSTRDIAQHLEDTGSSAETTHQGWKRLDTGGWQGGAADAAREYLDDAAPREWAKAADACTTAGEAVAAYQQVHADAKARAERAKAALDRAEKGSEAAREKYNKTVDEYNATVQQANSGGPPPGAAPAPFVDPFADEIAEAKRTIAQARQEHRQAGDRAATIIRGEAAKAPEAPGFFARVRENIIDIPQAFGGMAGEFLTGAGGAVGEMYQFARIVAPFDPFNQTNPMAYQANLTNLGAGLVESFKNPYTMVKASADIDGWRTNPLQTAGSTWAGVLMSAAGGGGAAGRITSRIGSTAMRNADVDVPTPKAPNSDPRAFQQPPQPSGPAQPPGQPTPSHPGSQPPPASQQPSQQSGFHSPESQPWGSDQPSGWHQSPGGTPGESPGISGTREDGGFGPRGSNPEPPEAPIEHQAAPSQRTMPHDAGDDVPDQSILEDVRDRPMAEPEARPESTPIERTDNDTPRHDPTPEPDPVRPAPDSHGEPGYEPSDQERQTYRERIEMRTGQSFEENVAQLRAEHPELAHMDDEKAMSVRRYVGTDANSLNHTLREGDDFDRKHIEPEVNVLHSALDEMPPVKTAETPRAFRDISVSDERLAGMLEHYRPGAIVEEPAFTSASKDIPPGNFSEHGPDRPNKIRFIIDEPSNARDLESINPEEREVLWQNGNRFGVDLVKQVGEELHIEMRDLGQGGS